MKVTISFTALTAALQLSATAASAQCPTADNLQTGIRFTLADGETETFRKKGAAIVEAVFEYKDPPASRVLLAQGVYLLELIDLENGMPQPGTRSTYSYPMTAAEMPLPQPGGHWSVTAAVLDMGDLRRDNQVYTFGTMTQATYGACSYDMLPITITYPGDESDPIDLLHYLPGLGLSYLAESTYSGSTDRYDYIAIEALQ